MKKIKKSCFVIFYLFFFITLIINNNNLNMIKVQGLVEPTVESEIIIGIDIGHQNNLTKNHLTNLTSILNKTFSFNGITYLKEFNLETLSEIDVLIILAPTIISTDDVEVVESYLHNGKSLFVGTGFRNQSVEPSNSFLRPYGLNFNLSSSIIPEEAKSQTNQTFNYFHLPQNFTTPSTPVTENLSQLIYPNGLGISFNESKLESYRAPDIIRFNPLLLMNSDESPSENNTLAASLEFENGARILSVGSADMFNNSFIEPLTNDTDIFMDNTEFILKAIKWLGKNTGIMNFYDSWVDLDNQRISIGQIINGSVILVDSQNKSLIQGQVTIVLERDGHILNSRSMRADPSNNTRYSGWISTKGLSSGWTDVMFLANRVGYLPVEIKAGRVFIDPPFPTPILPSIAMWGLAISTVIIFAVTAVFVWANLKGKE